MFDLDSYLVAKRRIINEALNEILQDSSNPSLIIKAMRYSLMGNGKRLRPILCLAAAEAVGGKEDDALPAACAIEMIHTYSLIHDDLPALDNDDLRRGKPTCHIEFDESTAILAGDALLTLAFQILSSTDFIKKNQAPKWLNIVNTFARAAGYQGMIEGQMRDLISEGQQLDLDELETMHVLKTGAIIEASVYSGAVLGNGNLNQIKQLRIYARNIGLAFQVSDDILNVEGDPTIMGKAVGTDRSRNKNTYPSIIGVKQSKLLAKNLVSKALQSLDYFDKKVEPLRAIASYIIERKR